MAIHLSVSRYRHEFDPHPEISLVGDADVTLTNDFSGRVRSLKNRYGHFCGDVDGFTRTTYRCRSAPNTVGDARDVRVVASEKNIVCALSSENVLSR